ncbi:arogenate dehydrogenase 2, chloroplastic-like [Ananas comosus]|uniref:Arogenate dehydrogenase 2, chloroplastic-like n=1 Tax=Ananas comosus TaxID=4615 RepID=A0A6P5FXQ7_ANACO|nr:arogenate dehydrogenase 2, chloroplastic-like [Ananas comosus]
MGNDTAQTGHEEQTPVLKIAIIGFGNFGQFIANGIERQGHIVLATSRSDYSEYCERHGIQFFQSMDAMCEEQPDIVFVCSSILSTESVLRAVPLHKLKPDTIFADVLSVKQFPRNLFLEVLPAGFGVVCTHPMFGPESGKHGWKGLPFVYDKVRVSQNGPQAEKCAQFLNIFEQEGCRMVEMSCEEHDRHAAGSQFITHTIGRILSHLNLESTPINTKGYETLLQLTENTVSDSFDLYYGLFMYNVNATEQIENLDRAFETVKQKLFGRLHDILRKQIVERVPMQGIPIKAREPAASAYFLPPGEKITELSSFAMAPQGETRQSEVNLEPTVTRR